MRCGVGRGSLLSRRESFGGVSAAALLLAAGLALVPTPGLSQAIDRSGGAGGDGRAGAAGGGGGGGFGAGGDSLSSAVGAAGTAEAGGLGANNPSPASGAGGSVTGPWIVTGPVVGIDGAGSLTTGIGANGGGTGFIFRSTIGDDLRVVFGSSITGGDGGFSVQSGAGGGGTGLFAYQAVITVDGGIAGGVGGGNVDNGIAGGGGAGAFLSLGGSFEILASGTVRGGAGGGGLIGGAGGAGLLANSATVINGGSVAGGAGGVGGGVGSGSSRGGGGGAGAEVWNSTMRNAAGATISGGMGGTGRDAGGPGGVGVVLRHGGTSSLTNSGTITGGAGGATSGAAVGGGAGGIGVFLNSNDLINASGGVITGGAGGASPNGFGGNGGIGVVGTGGTVINEAGASIAGGRGGLGDPALPNGGGGYGVGFATGGSLLNAGSITGGDAATRGGATIPGGYGVVVTGGGVRIINAGSITGGLTSDGTTRAAAVALTASGNTLELRNGYSFAGDVVAAVSGNTLALGGTEAAAFDVAQLGAVAGGKQFQGFSIFEKIGSSTWTLAGASVEVTPWTIAGGTLSVASDAALGASAGSLTVNGGVLQVTGTAFTSTARAIVWGPAGGGFDIADAANSFTVSQALTGGGGLTKLGAGTLILSGINSYSGGTTVNQGVLQVQTTASLGSGTVTLDGGTLRNGLVFNGFAVSSGLVVGSRGGTLDAGLGMIQIFGAVSDASRSGTLTITGELHHGNVMFVNPANTYRAKTHITATGQLSGAFAGSFSPNSDYIVDGVLNMAFAVEGATLRSLSGAATGRVYAMGTHDRTLTIAMPDGVADFAGTIMNPRDGGMMSVVKTGDGHQILSGRSFYVGSTTVNGGTLTVNGSIADSVLVTVNAGGTLGGTGKVGPTLINAGGTLAPGNSIGTLAVEGNLAFAAGATYSIEVSPLGSDRTNVSGGAMLGGATVAAFYAPGSYVTKRYTILTAGSVNGSFAGPVNTNLPANFATTLAYDATNVYLDLTLNYVPPGPTPPNFGAGLTVNQANVAGALVNSFNTAGGIPLAFGALTASGLSGASGEAATGIQAAAVEVMDRFLTLMTDPFANGRNASAVQMADLGRAPRGVVVAEPARWSAWASGYGGVQATGGNAAIGSHGTSTSIYGSAFGADYRVSPDTTIGFALGAAGTSYRLGQGLGGGSSDVFQIGLYGRHRIGAAYVAAALAYGWQDVTTERRFMGDRLTGRFTANAFSGRIETGYRFATAFAGLTPYAAGQFVSFSTPDYREQAISGTGLFALDYAGRSATAWRTELGLRADKAIQLGEAELTLRGRLAWAHNFNVDRLVGASFSSLPASSFIVHGASQAADMLLTSAGAELKWANGWSAAATFEGGFSNRGNSYAGRGTVRYQW